MQRLQQRPDFPESRALSGEGIKIADLADANYAAARLEREDDSLANLVDDRLIDDGAHKPAVMEGRRSETLSHENGR